jgi:thermitase
MVDWVEPNEVIALTPLLASITASKSDYPLNDPDLKQLWGFDAMKVQSLYQHLAKSGSKPRKMALIAILDTGVDATHEDIRQNYRSIAEGYDNDPLNHGTHCAGIAAAVSNNGKGIASFSLDNSLFRVASVKVLNSGGSGTQQGIIRGIIEAADAGADVISMSLGGRTGQVRQNAYTQAVEYAAKKGAIVVAAAGNSNRNAREFAPVNTPGVIGVSAIDVELNRAAFSNWVEDIPLALAAPGVNIYSTIPGNKYASFNGTSMATPYVAGLIGLMKSFKPELTAREAWEILHRTGKETRNTKETGRLIQPAEALKALQ